MEERFATIRDEAEARGTDLSDPGRFVMLGEAGATLQRIRGPDEPPELIHQHGALLFHAWHFWNAGEPLYLLSAPAARYLVEGDPPLTGWIPTTPSSGGYLQLPRHLFWAAAGEEETPESLDGFFWSRPEGSDRLSLLAVLGVRPDRAGVSVVPLPTVALAEAPEWSGTRIRESGEDFRSTIPGAELDRLYSVETAGELLKLAARVLWYLDTAASAVEDPAQAPADADGPEPSRLPYRRIGLA